METYQEFLDRTGSFETRELHLGGAYFQGNPSLAQKVGPDNAFRDFYGDTVIFALDGRTKEKLSVWVDALYRAAPGCFCRRLGQDTFHVTLHDLSSSPSLRDSAPEMFVNELRVLEKLEELQKHKHARIRMQSTYIFNMVNTSLVLGLRPAGEEDHRELMELYSIFDGVRKLPYPFTPHITLAYYRVNGFDPQSAGMLEAAAGRLNGEQIEIELSAGGLYYQKFTSMESYFNIIHLDGIP